MDRPRTLRDAAAAAGVGALAGVLGTAAMTISSTLEAKARGRGPSTTPATAVENTLGVEPRSEEHEKRLNNLAHWGYGASLGALRGLLAAAELSGPAAAGAHLGLVYGMEQAAPPATGLSSPAWTCRWGGARHRPGAPSGLHRCHQRGLRVAGPPVTRAGATTTVRRPGGLRARRGDWINGCRRCIPPRAGTSLSTTDTTRVRQ